MFVNSNELRSHYDFNRRRPDFVQLAAAALGGLVVLEAWLVVKAHQAPAVLQPLIRHLRWLLRALAHWLAWARARRWRAPGARSLVHVN